MSFWIKHGVFQDDDGSLCYCLPGRLNTRRNRRRSFKHFLNKEFDWLAIENKVVREELRNAPSVWRVQNFLRFRELNPWMGKRAALKFFAAWWEVKLRVLSREVHQYTRVALRKEAA